MKPDGEREPCFTTGCLQPAELPYTSLCASCFQKREDEIWAGVEKVDWDGVTPLVVWKEDRYFFDADDLIQYCNDHGVRPQDLKLLLCEKVVPRTFEIFEFLDCDLIGSDGIANAAEIDDRVNQLIRDNFPVLWTPRWLGVCPESLPKIE